MRRLKALRLKNATSVARIACPKRDGLHAFVCTGSGSSHGPDYSTTAGMFKNDNATSLPRSHPRGRTRYGATDC